MPERALRLPIKGLDPKSVFARFKKQNARKGIKTDRRLFVRHSQKGLKNKMPERALRQFSLQPSYVIMILVTFKKQNARKGIKTKFWSDNYEDGYAFRLKNKMPERALRLNLSGFYPIKDSRFV